MATYFPHHHHHPHHGNNSDIIPPRADSLQTLILMEPNFLGYSDTHPPPPLPPHLFGFPFHSTSDGLNAYPPPAPAAWTQPGPMQAACESPHVQQGLSLSLSSQNYHSYELHHSPAAAQTMPVCSESPVVGALMASKYLKAAQDLLEEAVNVSVDRVKAESAKKSKGKDKVGAMAGGGAEEERTAELTTIDRQELQMKKANLITLLDEVEQRQRQYHQQMQILVSSFEHVAGAGSARTYTSLTLKAISNHFRSLRDAILGQIRAANKSLGEEGGGASRLRFFDHQTRQQRTLQQLGMIQNNAWRPQRQLPEKAVSGLRAWLFEHFLHPYPKDSDKIMLAKQTGLTRSQVSNWFINARVRIWKPMIEEIYAEEVKGHQQNVSRSVTEEKDHLEDIESKTSENHNSSTLISSSTASIPPFENTQNPSEFTFVGSSTESNTLGSLKKQRNNEILNFPDAESFNGNKGEVPSKSDPEKREECSIMSSSTTKFIGGLGSYPIGEIGRFDPGQFPQSFSGNGISLTIGLPHCESLSLPGTNQAFLPDNKDIDHYRGRLDIGELSGFGGVKTANTSHSRSAYGAQLLPDFIT